MSKKITGLNIFRGAMEITALLLVIILVGNHKLQMWLIIFAGGVMVSLFGGRLFCAWICPMNTIFRGIDFIYKKLKIKRFNAPEFLKNNIVRYIFLALFILSMVVVKMKGLHLNMLLYIILFSVALTMFVNEEFWHRYLCPFGTILSFTSRKARYGMHIEENECIACGKCQKVCPSASILTIENKKRKNKNNECLMCRQCIDICPVNVCGISKK
ncbi:MULTISPECIES: 4Fe-4S binding protein [unclassified Oceanispirochaeta]|uniref:4Fe-4S binding protein n=1 Tax=unclassified Oceanispirochaeta TaxID=2635722 RepID=UPI000E08DE92|nr:MULTISPECIES: 4Fe-4S binding protein [unclassified Oceanispirochaeta]MBF9017343.1 4Fe-4S binding protein [Oceanispirochaeta sp. M2]NPD73718.1 4Fe-4S binding protein [Oceanispirochaeta sp. M1]RDG30472.1 4Fe-4S binding protein [Oceanispirochaeta sp. M1]